MIKYAEWDRKLVEANETEIFHMTGCLSTCDIYEYSAEPEIEYVNPSETESNIIQIGFHFKSGRHELKEQANIIKYLYKLLTIKSIYSLFQYIIYDWDSCFADVGGYLGLLLGQSIYGIYETAIVWLSWIVKYVKIKMNTNS